jgi:integrase
MKGSIRQRSPGHYAIILDLIDVDTGKRRRKWHSFKGTKRQAQIECARLIAAKQTGTYLEPSKTTIRAYLEKWLEHIKPNVAPRTYERYEILALKNIAPLLGNVILSKLQPIQISAAYAKAVTSGRRDGKGGLSARTVHHMHRVLRGALGQAVKWNMLIKNPCEMLEKKDRPKIERKPVAVMDATGTVKILEAARGSRWFVPMLLGAMCGIRRGEICALRWRNVNFATGQIAISHSIEQTKGGCREKETKGSKCRTVAMPSLLIEELKAWRAQQAQEFLRLGMRPDSDTRIVTKSVGTSPTPQSLTDVVSRFMKKQGSALRLHGLRHSHASHLLAENVHPKIVQERLGHYSIATTMDIYSHLMPNMQTDATAKLDAAWRAAKKSK